MKYTIVTSDDYNNAIAYKSNEDIKIESIRETFIPNINKKLTNDGKLYIKFSDTDIHLYNLWEIETINFDQIQTEILGAEDTSPNYESTHRIILNKDKVMSTIETTPTKGPQDVYAYSTKLIRLGKGAASFDNQKDKVEDIYSLDVDYVEGMKVREDGLFTPVAIKFDDPTFKNKLIYKLYTNYNKLFYLNITNFPEKTANTNPQFFYRLSILADTKKNLKVIDYAEILPNKKHYMTHHSAASNLDDNIDNYLILEIFGNKDTPDQICLEVR